MDYAWIIGSSDREKLTHTVRCATTEPLDVLTTDANKIVALATRMGSMNFQLYVSDDDEVSINLKFGSEVSWVNFTNEFANL